MGPSDHRRSKSSRKVEDRSKKRKKSKKAESSSEDEISLSKELHPIGHYVDDRKELLRQVFKVIRGTKLQAMLTSQLRNIENHRLKKLCLEQLEGMSKKRIIAILSGEVMDDSSDTSDDSDEELLSEKVDLSPDIKSQDAHKSVIDNPTVKSEKSAKKTSKEIKKNDTSPVSLDLRNISISKKGNMDLLELEMRARAIKSFLQSTDQKPEKKTTEVEKETHIHTSPTSKGADSKTKIVSSNPSEITINVATSELPKEVFKERAYEEKKLQKARDELLKSEAKKRADEEAKSRKDVEMKKKNQERLKQEKIAMEKQAAEEEKAKKKAKKQADYEKFLKWKEEKLQKEADARITKENLRQKEEKMKADETKEKTERDLMVKSTSLKKRKIHREVTDKAIKNEARKSSPKEKIHLKRRRYRMNGEDEDGEVSEDSTCNHPFSGGESPETRSEGFESSHEDSLSLSESDEDIKKSKREREERHRRVQAIKERKRRKKRESEIEDGEVDSDGESFGLLPSNPNTSVQGKTSTEEVKKNEIESTSISLSRDEDFPELAMEFDVQLEPDSSETEEDVLSPNSIKEQRLEIESVSKPVEDEPKEVLSVLEEVQDDEECLTTKSKINDLSENNEVSEVETGVNPSDPKSMQSARIQRIKEFQARTEIQDQVVSTLEVHEDGDSDVTMATNKDVKLEVKSKSVKSNPENAKNFRRNIKNSKCSEKVVLKSLNKDQPTKKEVDDEQEEAEAMVTWADRWLQDEKVQKVVKDSKLLSKARSNIKVKLKTIVKDEKQDAQSEKSETVCGSMEEYAKIVGKSVETIATKTTEKDNSSDDSNESEDDLWGDILGKG